MQRVWIGCSGWSYKDWRGGLYPDGLPQRRWLERYAEVFGTVEVNATFYRLPKEKTVQAWVEQVPGDFLFAVKASRYLTHMKRLTDVERGLERFYTPLLPLIEAGRLGPVLWQLPGDFRRDDARLGALLNALTEYPAGRHCLEFRHPSWFTEEIYEQLRWHGAALVIGDRKGLDFQPHRIVGDWTFVRFHHGHRGRRGNYSPAEIAEWAQRIRAWTDQGDVFAFYNNDWEGFAPRNARTLQRLLA